MTAAQLKKPKQYFLAIVPPPPVYEEALLLKNYFKEKFNSKASLNSPPHITLHMPFRWEEEKEEGLFRAMEEFAQDVAGFTMVLRNFNAFAPRVIFIDIVPNQHLTDLQKKLLRFCRRRLNLFNADYKDQPFHPHLTLAFRDLKKSMFKEAWAEFSCRKFEAEFPVNSFYILKHNGRIWEVFREVPLST